MKAILLAAGIGSRLEKITKAKPKCLVCVNGKPILAYIIDGLIQNSIKNIIICIGYKSTNIKNYCKENYPKIPFIFIENKNFDTTNNLYSLYLARRYFNDDIILINSDVILESQIITGIKKQKVTSVAVDTNQYNTESMKVEVNKDSGKINKISKKILKKNSYGCSIDVYKIIKNDMKKIYSEIKRIIEDENNRNQWTEFLLNNLFQTGDIQANPYIIGKKKWFEIDTMNDLVSAEKLFNSKLSTLKQKRIFFFDRDGTITLDKKLINGVGEVLEKIKNQQKLVYVISNNSSKTPKNHADSLKKLGLRISYNNILISTDVAIEYFNRKKIKKLFWVANTQVSNYLKDNGLIYNEKNPEAVLLTYDTQINYKKISKLTNFVRHGIPYYATHPDAIYPTPEGGLPDIGTFIEMIRVVTEKTPHKIFGKPDPEFINFILKKHNLTRKNAVIVGDRLYTDIQLASNSKITSILVLTGDTNRQDYEFSNTKADIVINNIKEIYNYV